MPIGGFTGSNGCGPDDPLNKPILYVSMEEWLVVVDDR